MALLSKCGVGHLVTLGLYSSTLTHFFSCCLFFMLHISPIILSSWQVVHLCKAKRRKEMGTSVRLFMTRSISHGFSLLSLKVEYPDGCEKKEWFCRTKELLPTLLEWDRKSLFHQSWCIFLIYECVPSIPSSPSPLSLSFSLSHCVIKCFSADQPLFPECSIRVHAL